MNLREKLVNFFEEQGSKFKSEKFIFSELNIDIEQYKDARQELEKLSSIGYILKKRNSYARNEGSYIYKGRFQSIKGGGGFFILENSDSKDIFIKRENTNNAFDGDIILCKVSKRKNEFSAKVLYVVKRTKSNALGIVSQGYFLPFEGGEPVSVSSDMNNNVAVVSYDENGDIKETIKLIGEPFNVQTCLKAIEAKYSLSRIFTREAVKESESFGSRFQQSWIEGRKDLRNLFTITIDPKDAKDFDDAISVEKKKGELYKIYVHIADVSFFVKEGSKLDEEAKEKGNSIYLPGTVYPMLPENLSNNLCSLNENEEKLCVTAEIDLDSRGKFVKSEFYESVIKSSKRLNYEEAEEILNGRNDFEDEVTKTVKIGFEIASLLHDKRHSAGALDFDLPEPRLELQSGNIIENVFPEIRLKSHRLIEEFMLAANQSVAEFLSKRKIPFLYRIHQEPDEERLKEIFPLLAVLGETITTKSRSLSSKDLQKIVERAKGRPFERLVNYRVLRAMMKAKYSSKPGSHFGLALSRYCHFTSPIRRYPDLVVHRALKKALYGSFFREKDLDILAEHLSLTEQNGDEAEREAVNWLILIYLKDKIGETFDALVTGFSNFGIKIELVKELIEGICPFNFIDYDRFI
ncbi:MAG: VacB/RNase II family 3'-5' exoribonuclease, partial [Acidobacteria bacterium]|nr:VacB/RNase II family 3'-5' exoribonuclease [Acidobacteriota bacterium]